MKTYKIAVLPGDGIGKEIMPHALTVLGEAAEAAGGFRLDTREFPWGCEYFLEHGVIMPEAGIETLKLFDAIYFVAAGHPAVTDFRSAWEFIFVIRKNFKQYINVRPVQSWAGVPILLSRATGPIDFVIVRENSEGEYAGPGGLVHPGWVNEVALQTSVFTRHGVERVARFAFDLARKRRKRVTNVTKSNALLHGLVFWDKVMAEVAEEYKDVAYDVLYVDAATMKFVQNPAAFDVIVSTNLFGDILSDLGGSIIGSVGLSPSANLNPEREFPSMFEPVHGSAPDIAGRGVANPVATILAGAMMLEHLGEALAARLIRAAVADTLNAGLQTRDLGGDATTAQVAGAIATRLQTSAFKEGAAAIPTAQP